MRAPLEVLCPRHPPEQVGQHTTSVPLLSCETGKLQSFTLNQVDFLQGRQVWLVFFSG
jgi:hypothetical protein